MKTFMKFFFLGAILLFSVSAVAQEEDKPTVYYSMSYMKVEPEMRKDYIALEKAWKKIHQAQVKAGAADSWTLERVVSPIGSSTAYNYITRHRFTGKKQLAAYMSGSYMPENWESLLTAEEIKLVNRTIEIREFVKEEVWSNIDMVLAEEMSDAKVNVFNYFALPKGKKRSEHYKMEEDIWMPVHEARIEANQMKGWVMLGRQLPIGSEQAYDVATVDIYTSMEQLMTSSFIDFFETVHPGKDFEDLMGQTEEVANRLRAEIRVKIDSTEE